MRARPGYISLVWSLLLPVQGPDVVQAGDAGGEPAVEAEHGVLHHRGEGEEVEQVGEQTPDLGRSSQFSLVGDRDTVLSLLGS